MATVAALVGFAANSLLCRRALGTASIDAWSFTAVRLSSGAVVLFLLARAGSTSRADRQSGSWRSAGALFLYAASFSLAYLRLNAGVGALVLFAAVQATMIGWSIRAGNRPGALEWTGLAIAFSGLAVLAWPGAVAPDPVGLVLMAAAGIGWAVYSLRGRASRSPLRTTASNFLRSVPFALACLAAAATVSPTHASPSGISLAVASGAIASGLGYTLWYTALPGLSATRAAIVQLSVPALAAAAGVVLLGETPTWRLAISASMILGGVAVSVLHRRTAPAPRVRDTR
jgi:drug/metabolite transporter (DMT)-like permease